MWKKGKMCIYDYFKTNFENVLFLLSILKHSIFQTHNRNGFRQHISFSAKAIKQKHLIEAAIFIGKYFFQLHHFLFHRVLCRMTWLLCSSSSVSQTLFFSLLGKTQFFDSDLGLMLSASNERMVLNCWRVWACVCGSQREEKQGSTLCSLSCDGIHVKKIAALFISATELIF